MDETFTFARPEWLGEVTSTSDLLKERAAAARLPSGTVIAARLQTRGRGRMNAHWQSAEGAGVMFSFSWSGRKEALEAGALPMACALGVGDFLVREPWRLATQCKWPNDVLAPGDGKICGILAEGGFAQDGRFSLVVGIGVNIRSEPGRDAHLGRKTASLEDFVGAAGEVEELLPLLLENVQERIRAWETGGFAAIRNDLEKRLWGVGRPISAKTIHGRVEGVVEGLDANGELMLRQADGDRIAVASVSAIESGWM